MFKSPAGLLFLWALFGPGSAEGLPRAVCQSPPGSVVTPVPYGLDRRADPDGRPLEELLPAAVGPFERRPLDTDALPSDGDLNIEYMNGRDVLTVGFVVAPTVEDARCAVRAARDMTGGATVAVATPGPAAISESQDKRVSVVKAPDFVAWNHGRHFFYVKASTSAGLDLFMRHFAR